MSAGYGKLLAHQGDKETWPITISSTGSPSVVDLTGATFKGSIRKEYNQSVAGNFTIEETNLAIGKITLVLPASVSANLTISGSDMRASYVYDVQYILPGSPQNPVTFMYGHLIVQRQVTS